MYQNEKVDAVAVSSNRKISARLLYDEEVLIETVKSFTITSGSEDITLGSAVSCYIQATIDNQEILLSGKEVSLEIGLDTQEGIEYIPMGLYTIQNPKIQSNKISFTGYDRLASKCNGTYFSKLTYPVDALDVLDEIEKVTGISIDYTGLQKGITIDKKSITNEDEGITTTYVNPFDGYTYKETIGFIAGLFGKIAVCGRTGMIEFRWYSDTTYEIPSTIFYNDLQETEENFSVRTLICDNTEDTISSGAGITGISMQNPVMTQELLDSVYEKVKDLTFTPTTLRFIGDPRLDVGDIVIVVKNDGTRSTIPIMSLLTSFDGGLMQTLASYGNTTEEDDADTQGPLSQKIERTSIDLVATKKMIVENLTAVNGEFNKLSAKYAEIDFANIDEAHIKNGFVEKLMVSQGIFTNDIKAAEGTFTNYLTGVNILANNITAGTLSVERLVITGSEKSIVYEINNANGTEQLSQTTIDGGALTKRSVTADRIVAESITSNEINVTDLFAQDITATGTITGVKLKAATGEFSGTIYANDGKIAGWGITDNMLYSNTEQTIYTANKDTIQQLIANEKFPDSNFWISKNGSIKSYEFSKESTSEENYYHLNFNNLMNGSLACSYAMYDEQNDETLEETINYYASGIHMNSRMYNADNTKESDVDCNVSLYSNGTLRIINQKNVTIESNANIRGNLTASSIISDISSNNLITYSVANGTTNTYFHSNGYFSFRINRLDNWDSATQALYINNNGLSVPGETGLYSNTMNGYVARYYVAGSTKCTAVGNNSYATRIYGSSVWANKSISTSDERLKRDFETLDKFDDIYMSLQPVSFKYLKGYDDSEDIYFGLKAQSTEKLFESISEEPRRYALFSRFGIDHEDISNRLGYDVDFDEEHGLSYTNIIPWNLHMIQKTRLEMEDLKRELSEAKQTIQEMQQTLVL